MIFLCKQVGNCSLGVLASVPHPKMQWVSQHNFPLSFLHSNNFPITFMWLAWVFLACVGLTKLLQSLIHCMHIDAIGTSIMHLLTNLLLQERQSLLQQRLEMDKKQERTSSTKYAMGEDYSLRMANKQVSNGWNNGCQRVQDNSCCR